MKVIEMGATAVLLFSPAAALSSANDLVLLVADSSSPSPNRTAPSVSEAITGMTESEKAKFDTFVRHESEFKDHYDSHYRNSGYGYNQYRPAYQHGFEFGLDQRYAKMDWSTVEVQARRAWNDGTMGLWDRYKEAVHFGWERGTLASRG